MNEYIRTISICFFIFGLLVGLAICDFLIIMLKWNEL